MSDLAARCVGYFSVWLQISQERGYNVAVSLEKKSEPLKTTEPSWNSKGGKNHEEV